MKQSYLTVLNLIQALQPLDETEKRYAADAVQWIESGVNIFRLQKPDIPSKHLVAYFTVYDSKNKTFLLVDHKLSGLWLPSGGHVEVDEDPADTVRRECREELGIEANFVSELPQMITVTKTIGQGRHTDVSLWYLLRGAEEMLVNWDEREFRGVRWWSEDEISAQGVKDFDPHMLRFISKVKKMAAA